MSKDRKGEPLPSILLSMFEFLFNNVRRQIKTKNPVCVLFPLLQYAPAFKCLLGTQHFEDLMLEYECGLCSQETLLVVNT